MSTVLGNSAQRKRGSAGALVTCCIDSLRSRSLNDSVLFENGSTSGTTKKAAIALAEKFEKPHNNGKLAVASCTPEVVYAALKDHFQNMTPPIFHGNKAEKILVLPVLTDPQNCLEDLKSIVHSLGDDNFAKLECILTFFGEVVANNASTPEKLSYHIGPALVKSSSTDCLIAADQTKKFNKAVEHLIANYTFIFDLYTIPRAVRAMSMPIEAPFFAVTTVQNAIETFNLQKEHEQRQLFSRSVDFTPRSQVLVSAAECSNGINAIAKRISEVSPESISASKLLEATGNSCSKLVTEIKCSNEQIQQTFAAASERQTSVDTEYETVNTRMDGLFKELKFLESRRETLLKDREKARDAKEKAKQNLTEMQTIMKGTEKSIAQIDSIKAENQKLLKKWNDTIAKGDLCSFKEKEMTNLLEYLDMEEWVTEMNRLLPKFDLSDPQPFYLLALKKPPVQQGQQSERCMVWGEAKYICLVLEEIKNKKSLPALPSKGISLPKEIRLWSTEHVKTHFESFSLKNVSKKLYEAKVNGLVLLHIKEYDFPNFGFTNTDEIILFRDTIRKIQSKQEEAVNGTRNSSASLSSNNNSNYNNNYSSTDTNSSNQNNSYISSFSLIGSSSPSRPNNNGLQIPPERILCPLCSQVMTEPIIAEDGCTYDKNCLLKWFTERNEDISPTTLDKINRQIMIPNVAMRKDCADWLTSRTSNS